MNDQNLMRKPDSNPDGLPYWILSLVAAPAAQSARSQEWHSVARRDTKLECEYDRYYDSVIYRVLEQQEDVEPSLETGILLWRRATDTRRTRLSGSATLPILQRGVWTRGNIAVPAS